MKNSAKTNFDLDLNRTSDLHKQNKEMAGQFNEVSEAPMFGQSSEDLAEALTDASIKTAEINHKFKMREIRTQMLADVILELVRRTNAPIVPELLAQTAKQIVELTLGKEG